MVSGCNAMVADQIAARGVHDKNVLKAMNKVHREAFVPAEVRELAYGDTPLPIDPRPV